MEIEQQSLLETATHILAARRRRNGEAKTAAEKKYANRTYVISLPRKNIVSRASLTRIGSNRVHCARTAVIRSNRCLFIGQNGPTISRRMMSVCVCVFFITYFVFTVYSSNWFMNILSCTCEIIVVVLSTGAGARSCLFFVFTIYFFSSFFLVVHCRAVVHLSRVGCSLHTLMCSPFAFVTLALSLKFARRFRYAIFSSSFFSVAPFQQLVVCALGTHG